MKHIRLLPLSALLAACLITCAPVAHAGLFDDDEARRAILEMRTRMDKQDELVKQLQANQLDQLNQFEALRQEIAKLRGENEVLQENLQKQLAEQQSTMKGLNDRLSKVEPMPVKVDGVDFLADPGEVKAFDSALTVFRSGDFVAAASAFSDFVKAYPSSGYTPSVLFWLGNAQYANRDYKEAVRLFTTLVTKYAQHMRAPDGMLSLANCQIDMKDVKSARKTLGDLQKAYPQTEAANAAKELLNKLK
jgi:tol-pal system protein YbgF